jgi:hypothetical protein
VAERTRALKCEGSDFYGFQMRVLIRQLSPGKVKTQDLRFLVPVESRLLNAWRSFVAVFSGNKYPTPKQSTRMFRSLESRFLHAPARSLLASCLINAVLVFCLIWLIPEHFAASADSDPALSDQYEIYYVPPAVLAKLTMPKISPAGPGGVPGQGDLEVKLQKLGSTVFHGKLTAISQPKHPDNTHQTIIQPNVPPDIHVLDEVRLPNLVVENSMPPQPRAPVAVPWHAPTPTQKNSANTDLAPPTVATTSPNAVVVILGPSTSAPALPVPQPPPAATDSSDQKLDPAVENAIVNSIGAGGGKGIIVLSTDPSMASGAVGLPIGNRAGTFSISPYGGVTGSPGGVAGGTAGAGHGGKGSGGDGSVGVGTGKTGGGGGGTGTDSGIVSVNGGGGGSGSGTLVNPSVAADMVIQMAPFTPLRKNALIVSTGQMGGGGLGVYQALPCRKIYTVFLPMPRANWTLQYCAQDDSHAPPAITSTGSGATVQMPSGLVPPAAELQFDFKRLPVPPEKARKMIILKGAIRDDGTVEHVEIYSGVLPLMDEAARLAFSRWKFTPALRSGKPVAVQILVGIAVTMPKP